MCISTSPCPALSRLHQSNAPSSQFHHRDSIYMHKDAGKGIAMGPAWDFNEAFGECCGYPLEGYKQGGKSGPGIAGGGSISPNGWRFLVCEDPERCIVEPTDGVSTWFRRMWNDTRFSVAAAERWAELRADAWSDDAISSLINSTAVKARGGWAPVMGGVCSDAAALVETCRVCHSHLTPRIEPGRKHVRLMPNPAAPQKRPADPPGRHT